MINQYSHPINFIKCAAGIYATQVYGIAAACYMTIKKTQSGAWAIFMSDEYFNPSQDHESTTAKTLDGAKRVAVKLIQDTYVNT